MQIRSCTDYFEIMDNSKLYGGSKAVKIAFAKAIEANIDVSDGPIAFAIWKRMEKMLTGYEVVAAKHPKLPADTVN